MSRYLVIGVIIGWVAIMAYAGNAGYIAWRTL